jgi:biopolymer transport protein ExbD
MASKAVDAASKEEASMDMTPMIDVTFLLIIFFLCIEFKSLEAKLAAYLPKDVGVNTTQAEPVEKLDLRIFCDPEKRGTEVWQSGAKRFDLVGHEVRWELGAKGIKDESVLRTELQKAVKDKQADPKTGKMKPKPVTIHAYEDVTYGDVAHSVDLLKDVGFEEINFGGGRGLRKKKP